MPPMPEKEEKPYIPDNIPIRPGELVAAVGWNANFHRGYEFSLAVTDAALYMPIRVLFLLFPHRFRRIPLETIRSVHVSRAELNPFMVFALVSAAVVASIATLLSGISLFTSLTLVVAYAYLPYFLFRMFRKRTRLVIVTSGGVHSIISPTDDYDDEKQHDRAAIRKVTAALKARGIQVMDEGDNCGDSIGNNA